MSLKAHADEIASEVAIDPLTIIAFLTAILPLIELCFRRPEDAAEWLRQDTKATRRQVRHATIIAWRDQCDEPAATCPPELVESMQWRCATISDETMREIYARRDH